MTPSTLVKNQAQEPSQAYLDQMAAISANSMPALPAPLPTVRGSSAEPQIDFTNPGRRRATIHGIRELSSPLSD